MLTSSANRHGRTCLACRVDVGPLNASGSGWGAWMYNNNGSMTGGRVVVVYPNASQPSGASLLTGIMSG